MNDQTVKEIIVSLKENYQKSTKKNKSNTLDHLTIITQRNRKHLIKTLAKESIVLVAIKRSGRPKTYSKEELLPHIRFLWLQMERVSP